MDEQDEVKRLTVSADIAIFAAFVSAQGEFTAVKMNQQAGITDTRKYWYADLASVYAATRPALNKFGISVSHKTSVNYDTPKPSIFIQTILRHRDGGMLFSDGIEIRANNESAQAIGQAITYARRYDYSAFIGISGEEDLDGAHEDKKQEPAKSSPPKAAKPATQPPLLIPPAAIKEIERMLAESEADRESFFIWIKERYKVDSLDKITAGPMYKAICDAIASKIKPKKPE